MTPLAVPGGVTDHAQPRLLDGHDSPIGGTPALIVVDAQQSEPDRDASMDSEAASIPGGREAVLDRIGDVVAAARAADVPIVWGRELHRPDFADYGAELASSEPEHGLLGSRAERFPEALDVDPDAMRPAEYLIEKRRYNFFHRTDLEHVLDTYDVDTVLLVGFMTNVCVHYTAHGAHERDYLFRAVEECTAAPTRDLHEAALRFMRYLQPNGVPGVEDVLAALSDYGGNPLVRRVKETGRVTDRTGPVRD